MSIHTLACAAYEILLSLNRASNGAMIKDWIVDMVGPELSDEFRRFINMAQNFFKHADKDAHSILDFPPEATDVLILDGVGPTSVSSVSCCPSWPHSRSGLG